MGGVGALRHTTYVGLFVYIIHYDVMKLKYSIVIIAATFVIVGAFALRYQGEDKRTETDLLKEYSGTITPALSPAQGLRVGRNAIYIPEQLPTTEITVGFVALARPGFIVIHEGVDEGAGMIVGASFLLPAGEIASGARIILSRTTRDGEEFTAKIHTDDGDGIFDASKDQPVRDEQGNIVMMSFTVSVDAEAGGEVSL